MKQRHHHHRRITILMSRHHMEALQNSYARGSAVMHARAYARRYTRESTAQTKAEQSTNMHRLVCFRIFGSCCQCSFSACYRVLATVRAQITSPFPASHAPCLICYKRCPSRCQPSVLPSQLYNSASLLCPHPSAAFSPYSMSATQQRDQSVSHIVRKRLF